MGKKINITELLKDCPKGMELDCTICNGVKFIELDRNPNFPIVVRANNGYEFTLTKYGQIHNIDDAKCVIYPKGKTTWEGFQRPIVDGDILSYQHVGFKNRTIYIYMYHNRMNTTYYVALSGYSGSEFLINYQEGYALNSYNDTVRFATEEEKAKLFQAIKDNGYKWNPETKTLEKLTELTFKVGDRIRHKNSDIYCTLGEYSEGISAYRTDIGLSITYKDLEQWELVTDKFDINTLKPFKSNVLIRDNKLQKWHPATWGFYDKDSTYHYKLVGNISSYYCIPYEGNEHLIGTSNDCSDFYKTWDVLF